MTDNEKALIRNHSAEFSNFTAQAGEPHSAQDVLPTSEDSL